MNAQRQNEIRTFLEAIPSPLYVDERVGCIAVRIGKRPEPGSGGGCHSNDEDVLCYRMGHQELDDNGGFVQWCIDPQDRPRFDALAALPAAAAELLDALQGARRVAIAAVALLQEMPRALAAPLDSRDRATVGTVLERELPRLEAATEAWLPWQEAERETPLVVGLTREEVRSL